MLFYGVRLSLRGEDLHRVYGLFTRWASSLPRRRIQVLKIEESLPRRLVGLATLRADTAGSAAATAGQEPTGRDVLLPVVPRAEVEPLLPAFFPDLDPEPPDWRRVSPRAIRRGAGPGTLFCLLLAGGLFYLRRDLSTALAPLLAIPLFWLASALAYRYLGYAFSLRYLWTRRGALSRATHVVPIRNIQTIVVRQTPFDRVHRVASLLVDTAGQTYTGGGPQISNVPAEDALALARTLARQAARLRYRW